MTKDVETMLKSSVVENRTLTEEKTRDLPDPDKKNLGNLYLNMAGLQE